LTWELILLQSPAMEPEKELDYWLNDQPIENPKRKV
jgi:hypothetical protein